MYDIKDVSKTDIMKKQNPPQTLRKESKALKFLRKIPFFRVDELVSNTLLMINNYFNYIDNFYRD